LIPFVSPLRQNEPLIPQFEQKIGQLLRSGQYILGAAVESFEKNLSAATHFSHAVGCANGTDALVLAMKALPIPPGSEVVTPAYSFIASSAAIVWAGMRPVFADIDPDTFCVTAESVERVLTPNTRVVMAVDLYGRQAPIAELRELCAKRKIFLIEDGAQSIGVPNHRPHLFTTSFYPTKNIGAVGDAGAVLTDDPDLEKAVRETSRHGGLVRDEWLRLGTTSRLDALQAAVLDVKLAHLEEWTRARRKIALHYCEGLETLERQGKLKIPPREGNDQENVWSLFTVRLAEPERRSAVR